MRIAAAMRLTVIAGSLMRAGQALIRTVTRQAAQLQYPHVRKLTAISAASSRANCAAYMPPRSSLTRSPNFHGGTDRGDQSGIGRTELFALPPKLCPQDHPVMMTTSAPGH